MKCRISKCAARSTGCPVSGAGCSFGSSDAGPRTCFDSDRKYTLKPIDRDPAAGDWKGFMSKPNLLNMVLLASLNLLFIACTGGGDCVPGPWSLPAGCWAGTT